MQLIPVILDSEAGAWIESRLRASSTTSDEYRLLHNSMLTASTLACVQKLLVITNRDFFYQTAIKLPQAISFILGDFRRNTAAIVAAAASHIARLYGEETLLLVLATNRLHVEQDTFQDTIATAINAAIDGSLVTFGMPSYETNTSYVDQTKPLATQQFLWNSNLFLFKAGAILQAMNLYCPEIVSATLDCLMQGELTEENNCLVLDLNHTSLFSVPRCSINDDVMKRSRHTVVVPCDLDWLELS